MPPDPYERLQAARKAVKALQDERSALAVRLAELARGGDEEPGLLVRAGDVPLGPPRPSPRLWLEVPDARAAGAALAAAGVALLGEPRELRTGWLVEVADPWGNVIGLTDYRNAPERARRAAGRPH